MEVTSPPSVAVQSTWSRRKAVFLKLIVEYFLPLCFLIAITIALAFPYPGRVVGSWSIKDFRIVQAVNNFVAFFISGLTLKTAHLRSALRYWQGSVYGVLAILAITPCLGFAFKGIRMTPEEFSVGLAIFCVMPTTLGVGVALTAASKGNQALALLLTVTTNLLGIVTVPYELRLLLRGSNMVSVEPGPLILKLVLTVLVPAVLGKALTAISSTISRLVDNHRRLLSMISHISLAMIIWQTLSAARGVLVAQKFTSILLVIVAAILMHVVYLIFNAAVIWLLCQPWLDLPVEDGIAALIMSSQKSAPVAVTVISYLTKDDTQKGLFAIPAIVGQIAQIFVGTALARYFSHLIEKQQQD